MVVLESKTELMQDTVRSILTRFQDANQFKTANPYCSRICPNLTVGTLSSSALPNIGRSTHGMFALQPNHNSGLVCFILESPRSLACTPGSLFTCCKVS